MQSMDSIECIGCMFHVSFAVFFIFFSMGRYRYDDMYKSKAMPIMEQIVVCSRVISWHVSMATINHLVALFIIKYT